MKKIKKTISVICRKTNRKLDKKINVLIRNAQAPPLICLIAATLIQGFPDVKRINQNGMFLYSFIGSS